MKMYVEGIVNCVKEEVFDLVSKCKGVDATMPIIHVIDTPIKCMSEIEDGITLGSYIPELKAVLIFKDAINTVLANDDIDEVPFIVHTLSHEMTHYLQHINGEEFDMETDYFNRSHEIEARKIADIVTKYYMAVNCGSYVDVRA